MTLSLSIVMPARDAAAHIGEALGSIATEASTSAGDVEVVVADGGSRDATREIAAAFAFVRLLEGPDGGIYQGFNRALAACRSTHVAFVNADDILPAGALRAITRALAPTPEAAMISGSAEFADGDGNVVGCAAQLQPMTLASLLFAIPAINARVFRRDTLVAAGGFRPEAGIAADRELLVRLLRAGVRGVGIPDVLYRYRSHAGSTTLSGDAAGRRRVWKAEIDLARYLLAHGELTAAEQVWPRRARALAQAKQALATRSPSMLDRDTIANLAPAVIAWRRWRGRLSGY